MISGAVAGLGTITPASGFVLPWHGMVIGIVAGSVCFWACTVLKLRFKYDDSLDVFGVHGIGGATGTLLCGVFATASVSISADAPSGLSGLLEGNPGQLLTQLYGVVVDGGVVRRRDLRAAPAGRLARSRCGRRRKTKWPGSTYRCTARRCSRRGARAASHPRRKPPSH